MPDHLDDALSTLHDEYVDAVNRAVAEDRADLLVALVDEYPDAALRLLAAPHDEGRVA
ncbi:MAG TPA: hypothetical protein VM367_06475 [Pseudonocardia sp.]|jgi:hypothetical protein|nr:hypothetical protein [Pseudonocardia sp.]